MKKIEILEKIKQKNWKQLKKKQVRKVKAKFSTNSILKRNSTKIILKKKHVEKHCRKTKIIWRNIVTIYSVLKKKTTKQNSQPTQYEKNKINKDHFGEKEEEEEEKFIKKTM